VKRLFFIMLLSVVSLFAFAQSVADGGAVLTAPRTYRKMSGDSVRLRASVAADLEKQADKVLAKILKANQGARRKAARELARKYRLGDRVIVRGDSGRDVRSVANALVKKLYIKAEDVVPTFDGGALLDGELYNALLRFQKDKGLPVDGRVEADDVKELRKRK
jgi:murein L,D-transpeptidase YcbB/YkuD